MSAHGHSGAMRSVRIGCSGWSYASWRPGLYPEGLGPARWLGRYAEVFDTVEINSTFYRLARAPMVERWVEQTPEGFLFAVKASRYLTHMRRLGDIELGVARFWEPLEPLRESGRLGPVLWQLPERFKRDDALLERTLALLPPATHCFEFRHASWFCGPIYSLLEAHGAALAIGDDARRALPDAEPVGPIAYLRLHFGSRGRGGNYSDAELGEWSERIARWSQERDVFAYFNNDWQGFAPANARCLRSLVARRDPALSDR